MPESSLMKFADRATNNGSSKLYWSRVSEDGAPFRGPSAPTYTQDEYDARVIKVADPKNGTFDTGIPEENAEYLKVLDGISNSWYQLLFIDRWRDEGSKHHMVYIEWLEYFMEDGSRSKTPQSQQLVPPL